MTPYRDADHSALTTVTEHILMAESLLGAIDDLRMQLRVQDLDDHGDLKRGIGEAWTNLWEQLQHARRIALRLGRDVSAFDAERARVPDPYLAAARPSLITADAEQCAAAAVAALRAEIPEIVALSPRMPKLAQPLEGVPRQLLGGSRKFRIPMGAWLYIGMMLALLLYAMSR